MFPQTRTAVLSRSFAEQPGEGVVLRRRRRPALVAQQPAQTDNPGQRHSSPLLRGGNGRLLHPQKFREILLGEFTERFLHLSHEQPEIPFPRRPQDF